MKLDNILIANYANADEYIEVKLADFGLSDTITPPQVKLHLKCGSPGYIAPEVLRGYGYTSKADIFSLGVIFY